MRPKRVILLLLIVLLCGTWLYCFNPTQFIFSPKCPFKMLTGWDCPGCGIQRAIHALFHGHFIEAISYHYYLAYSLPYALSFVVVWVAPDYGWSQKLRNFIQDRRVVYFYIITYFIWLFVRNILHI